MGLQLVPLPKWSKKINNAPLSFHSSNSSSEACCEVCWFIHSYIYTYLSYSSTSYSIRVSLCLQRHCVWEPHRSSLISPFWAQHNRTESSYVVMMHFPANLRDYLQTFFRWRSGRISQHIQEHFIFHIIGNFFFLVLFSLDRKKGRPGQL